MDRVKVEYTDPSEVYPQFARQLSQRLPLRELHWSSSSRPIRSISSLHIELVPTDGTKSELEPTSAEDYSGAQDDGPLPKSEGPRKERRHQIPGLRRTPYLKIYLLYCNDVDTYRASSRKQLREWVKEHTPPSQSSASLSKQENHDAFEWLIVHVILPATDGLTDKPRPSSNKGDKTVEKRPTSSRWSSRNSTSVIEKLRSEFNSTSKNAVDRVAQIQLVGSTVGGASQVDLRVQDEKHGWDDLVFKLKSLILASFDLRVSQYEDDIREREGQKKVFGWNFNTFFVLKEGLAMGFENMGLLDDALTVYQELAFGLKTVIEEQQMVGAEQQTAHIVDFTQDLYDNFKHAGLLGENTVGRGLEAGERVADPGTFILDTERKPFRHLILSNKISFFDFQCYIFARQVSLSLRLANAVNKPVLSKRVSAPQHELINEGSDQKAGPDLAKMNDHGPENLIILAEVTRSSLEFITSIAFAVRDDIQNALNQSAARQVEDKGTRTFTHDVMIDNFVVSWLFSASQCILEATSARSLFAQLDPLLRQLSPKASCTTTSSDDDPTTEKFDIMHRSGLPARTSSLPLSNVSRPLSPPSNGFGSVNTLDGAKVSAPGNSHPGVQDLAAERGDILALRRRLLGDLGLQHGVWQGELADFTPLFKMQDEEMQDVDLNKDDSRPISDTACNLTDASASTTAGLCNQSLLSALNSSTDFHEEFENTTISALAHYVVGDRKKSAEMMTACLAMARFQQKDYLSAASYFRQLTHFYAKSDWSDLEITMLDTYAQCLKYLNRFEDYVRIRLETLAKMIAQRRRRRIHGTADFLCELIKASERLGATVSVPLNDYFDNINLSKYISHFDDRDGFELPLSLQSLLPEDLQVQSVRVRVISTEEEQRSELWLTTESPQVIEPGLGVVTLRSNLMQPGWYTLDKIHVQSSNIRLALDLSPRADITLFPRNRNSASFLKTSNAPRRQCFLVWPRPESLDARMTHYECVNLEQPNYIKVAIFSGWNHIIKCKLSIRAASAGLRLHTGDAEILGGITVVLDKALPGSLSMTEVLAGNTVNIKIPYSLETDFREISVRALVDYTTLQGDYAFSCSANLPISLPLAINVQDSFKQDMLVSKFTIGPSTSVPVRISSCYLVGNRDFRVVSPMWTKAGLEVFPRQPLSLLSKIYKNPESKGCGGSIQNKLFLKIEYHCLDEEIRAAVEKKVLGDLSTTPFHKYSHVLRRSLLAALDGLLATQNLEVIGNQCEVHVGTFEEWAWDALLAGIIPMERAELCNWLHLWHEKNRTIPLDASGALSPRQHLTVPVEIPHMQVVQTATLRRLGRSSVLNAESTPIPIGQGLPMVLSISYTRVWDLARSPVTRPLTLYFRYEVQANADAWLVGGQRKGHFSAREAEIVKISLLLWPQKTGHLLVPALDTQLLASQDNPNEGSSAAATISCELDYRNLGDTILVVPDLMSTTVSLDPSGTAGGWLVESRNKGL